VARFRQIEMALEASRSMAFEPFLEKPFESARAIERVWCGGKGSVSHLAGIGTSRVSTAGGLPGDERNLTVRSSPPLGAFVLIPRMEEVLVKEALQQAQAAAE
jgi:hypothetical protein